MKFHQTTGTIRAFYSKNSCFFHSLNRCENVLAQSLEEVNGNTRCRLSCLICSQLALVTKTKKKKHKNLCNVTRSEIEPSQLEVELELKLKRTSSARLVYFIKLKSRVRAWLVKCPSQLEPNPAGSFIFIIFFIFYKY
ncbi:hypothetical protein HanIR_Chr11g0552801 [Helianthus annuus]|nr:hypothetical protein HanIR_Chr11g0552801 [Helianthus annuus]